MHPHNILILICSDLTKGDPKLAIKCSLTWIKIMYSHNNKYYCQECYVCTSHDHDYNNKFPY